MALAVILALVALLAAYFLVPLALEKLGLIRLTPPKGGWVRRDADAGDTGPTVKDDPPVRGGGGDFGGGGSTGGW